MISEWCIIFYISEWCIIFQDIGLTRYFSRFRTDALFFKISDWFFNISGFRTVFKDFAKRNFLKQYITDMTTHYRHVQVSAYSQLLHLISTSLTETPCIWHRRRRNPYDRVMWRVVYSRCIEWWFRRSHLTWPDFTVHTVLREGWAFVYRFVETEYLADFCEHGNELLISLKVRELFDPPFDELLKLEVRPRLKCDGTLAETRFRLSAKRTSPFKSVGWVLS